MTEPRDLNIMRVFFFVIGVITGVAITITVYTRPQAVYQKQYFNNCGHYPDGVSRCGHGSPDTNPAD